MRGEERRRVREEERRRVREEERRRERRRGKYPTAVLDHKTDTLRALKPC